MGREQVQEAERRQQGRVDRDGQGAGKNGQGAGMASREQAQMAGNK